MKKVTPATKNSNAPQKVLKTLEATTETKICISDIMTGEQLMKRLRATMNFIRQLSGLEYDVLIQIDMREDKRKERCESNAGTSDIEGTDNKD